MASRWFPAISSRNDTTLRPLPDARCSDTVPPAARWSLEARKLARQSSALLTAPESTDVVAWYTLTPPLTSNDPLKLLVPYHTPMRPPPPPPP